MAQLNAAAADSNVRAFLTMLRYGEGTSDADGFRRMFGGELFDSYADHPRKRITKTLAGKPITSTAAGAWQFLSKTWDGLVKQYALSDFTPQSQTLGAIALIAGRGALADVIAGRFEQAVAKCAPEWASLPGSPYGQPVITMAKARSLYEAAGGLYGPAADVALPAPAQAAAIAPPPTPASPLPTVEDRSTYPSNQESVMSPFIAAALPAILEAVPVLGRIFSSGSDVSERNIKAAEAVVSVAKSAIGAANEQDLVERLQTDPAAAAAVREAVQRQWFEIQQQAEQSRAAAREFVAGYGQQQAVRTVVGRFTFPELLTLLFVLISAAGAGSVLWQQGYSAEIKGSVITLMLIAGYTGVREFWFGSSPAEQAAAKKQGVGPG